MRYNILFSKLSFCSWVCIQHLIVEYKKAESFQIMIITNLY